MKSRLGHRQGSLPDRRRHLGGRGGAHPELQTKHGIFNHENLIFDDLIADRKYQSVFIFTPAPIKGATGSNGCPIAIIDPTSMTWSSAAVMSAAASIICGDLRRPFESYARQKLDKVNLGTKATCVLRLETVTRRYRSCGEVPERSNGAVSKTVVPLTGDRGFESLPLRHK